MCDKNQLYTSRYDNLYGEEYFRALFGLEEQPQSIDMEVISTASGQIATSAEVVMVGNPNYGI